MNMLKVLFATNNPAKVLKYKEPLKKHGVELITLKDLEIKLDIKETGKFNRKCLYKGKIIL